jgi:hypothetical protein
MKIQLKCPKCAELQGSGSPAAAEEWATIDDSGWFEFTCHQGHTQLIALHNLKFDLLYENGAYALLDGYPREAVATFASALERYYEFHLLVLAAYRGITRTTFDAAWKVIGNRSERQIGAYVVGHALEFGEAPPTLAAKQKLEKLRNDVVHNGMLPTEAQAIEFGDEVLRIIRTGIATLRTLEVGMSGLLAKAYVWESARRRPVHYKENPAAQVGAMTIASPVMASPTDADLPAALKRLAQFRHTWLNALDPRPAGPAVRSKRQL